MTDEQQSLFGRLAKATTARRQAEESERALIVQAVEAGVSVQEIAALVGVNRKTIYRWAGRKY